MSDTTVQVAVRVRPFLQKIDGPTDKFVCGVQMGGPTTKVFNPATGDERTFTFDYSFWSFGENDSHFAGNKEIYQELGTKVLDSSLEGYNVSLFAYGQTGSGKSFSMIGVKEDPGIVPLVAAQIFELIKQKDAEQEGIAEADRIFYEVEVAMMEIYNEEVRDLLNPKGNPSGGLRIRESTKTGPFVQDLTFTSVKSYAQIEKTMDEGTAMRTVRSTQMNDKSSRAHTIVQIRFSQKKADPKKPDTLRTTRESLINLVDLAGSERQSHSGVSGQGFKEAIAINTSLTFLGTCITKLAEQAEGKKKVVVPYRSSKLTFLLKTSLGGNSKTIMIAAIRPGAEYYEESLSTLRYADAAKKIKNKPIKNEDPRDAAIRALKEEIERLKQQLGDGTGSVGESATGAESDIDLEEFDTLKKELERSQEIIAGLEAKSVTAEELSRSNEEALASTGMTLNFDHAALPHILNLQEDEQQNGKVAYPFQKIGESVIGRVGLDADPAEEKPDIILFGLGISRKHAIVRRTEDNKIFINAVNNSLLYKNGVLVTAEVELNNDDRLIVGNNHVFKVVNPLEAGYNATDGADIDWEMAQKEFIQNQLNSSSNERQKEIEERMKEMEQRVQQQQQDKDILEAARKQMEDELKRQKEALAETADDAEEIVALQAKLAAQQEEIARKEREFEELRQQRQRQQQLLDQEKKQQESMSGIQKRILELLPLVKDANEIAKVLKKTHDYQMKMVHQIDEQTSETVQDLVVVDTNTSINSTTIIADEDFLVRIWKMKSIFSAFLNCRETGREWPGIEPDDDPFDIEALDEPRPYGTSTIGLRSLMHLAEVHFDSDIVDFNGSACGKIAVALIPCDEKGDAQGVRRMLGVNADTDTNITPLDLVGKQFCFKLKLTKAMDLRQDQCESAFVRYSFPFDDVLHETNMVHGANPNPQWKYERLVIIEKVTPELQSFLANQLLILTVSAKMTGGKKRGIKELTDEIQELKASVSLTESLLRQVIDERDVHVAELRAVRSQVTEKDVLIAQLQIDLTKAKKDKKEKKDAEKKAKKEEKAKSEKKQKKEPSTESQESSTPVQQKETASGVAQSRPEDLVHIANLKDRVAELERDLAKEKNKPTTIVEKKSSICVIS
uniref:Kinesin motor domain-containing protein n=1 Tax=Percolomonas cosmopolitus TaxID=63605 RepID=A0A7S1PHJ4_9EUKA